MPRGLTERSSSPVGSPVPSPGPTAAEAGQVPAQSCCPQELALTFPSPGLSPCPPVSFCPLLGLGDSPVAAVCPGNAYVWWPGHGRLSGP